MGTVLELSNLELPTRTQGRTGTVLARIKPAAAVPESAWLTATIRPAGTFDLQAARLRSHRAGEVIEDAAWDIERRGGLPLVHQRLRRLTGLPVRGRQPRRSHGRRVPEGPPQVTSGPRP
jgi:hypothetical protein